MRLLQVITKAGHWIYPQHLHLWLHSARLSLRLQCLPLKNCPNPLLHHEHSRLLPLPSFLVRCSVHYISLLNCFFPQGLSCLNPLPSPQMSFLKHMSDLICPLLPVNVWKKKIHERKSPPLRVHQILYHDCYLQLISLPLTHGRTISTA